MKTDLFPSCGYCWVFQICWYTEGSTLTASSFRIWNSSAGISSSPLALFIVMLPKSHLTSHFRMSGSGWVTTPLWLSRSLTPFLYHSSVHFYHLFLISSASIRSLSFLSFIGTIFAWNFSLVAVQLLHHVRLLATQWIAARQASLSITISLSLLKLMSIELVMPSNHLTLCFPVLLLPSVFPSIRVFSQWAGCSHQADKVLELQLQHESFQWIFGVDFLWNWLVWTACFPVVVLLVTQSCLFLTPDCSSPHSSVHGILQARVLGWVAIPFFKGSSWPRDWTQGSCMAGRFFTIWATELSLSKVFSSTTVQGHQFFGT